MGYVNIDVMAENLYPVEETRDFIINKQKLISIVNFIRLQY